MGNKGRKPTFDMHDIPPGKHPAWKEEDNRVAFGEDMKIHLYEVLDNLKSKEMDPEERERWEAVLESLGALGLYYKGRGHSIHNH